MFASLFARLQTDPQAQARARTWIGVFVFVSCTSLPPVTAFCLQAALETFPQPPAAAAGAELPAFSRFAAERAAARPLLLWAIAVASVLAAIGLRFTRWTRSTKDWCLALLAALNGYFAAHFAIGFLLAWFVLPALKRAAVIAG